MLTVEILVVDDPARGGDLERRDRPVVIGLLPGRDDRVARRRAIRIRGGFRLVHQPGQVIGGGGRVAADGQRCHRQDNGRGRQPTDAHSIHFLSIR